MSAEADGEFPAACSRCLRDIPAPEHLYSFELAFKHRIVLADSLKTRVVTEGETGEMVVCWPCYLKVMRWADPSVNQGGPR